MSGKIKLGDLVKHVRDPQERLGIVYAWGIHPENPSTTWVRVLWAAAPPAPLQACHLVRDLEVIQ